MRGVRIAVFVSMAAMVALGHRPASGPLSVSSRQARQASEFVRHATIYQIWLRSFTPEGTLKAAAARLPHIAELGANLVYLSPIMLQSKMGGYSNPFRIQDYFTIDPEYGTEADLKAFVERAHQLKLRVLMDIVFYHTSADSVMLKRPELYMQSSDGKVVLGNWRLPRPDFSKPETREYLIGNLLHWVKDVGVDGFRCDVAAGIPLSFWEEARGALERANPEVVLLAESEMPEEQLKAFDISYNFTYIADVLLPILRDGEPAYRIRESWVKQKAWWPRGARLIYTLDNHDLDRPVILFGERAAYAATVVNFTLDGIPFLYNGQELNDTTVTDHQAHRAIAWEIDKAGGTGAGASRLARLQAESFAKYKRLFSIRKDEPALTGGELVWVDNSAPESVVSFLRRKDGDQILVVVNLSNRKLEVTVDLPVADFMPAVDLLTGKRYQTSLAAGKIAFRTIQGQHELPAFQALVLKKLPAQIMETAR